MKSEIVKKSIVIDAEAMEVWEALTNPELTKKYFFNCRVHSGWKAGDPITFKGRIFLIRKIELTGTIIDVEPGKRLKYTLWNNDSEGSTVSTVTDELSYHNGQTVLTISDDVGQGTGAEKRYRRSVKGWDKVLNGLKKVVEERSKVYERSAAHKTVFVKKF